MQSVDINPAQGRAKLAGWGRGRKRALLGGPRRTTQNEELGVRILVGVAAVSALGRARVARAVGGAVEVSHELGDRALEALVLEADPLPARTPPAITLVETQVIPPSRRRIPICIFASKLAQLRISRNSKKEVTDDPFRIPSFDAPLSYMSHGSAL